MLNNAIRRLESWLFSHRTLVLAVFVAFTAVMGFFASKLRMDAGFEKQIPIGHEYVKTLDQYRDFMFGANRLTVVVKARHGTIWTKDGLARLFEVTQAVTYLPNVDRLGVQSLWTPNSFVSEITEEGFRSEQLIPGTVTADRLTAAQIAAIEYSTDEGGDRKSVV